MDKKLITLAHEQIVEEFASAYLYLAISAWASGEGLKGMAKWMEKQASEELQHGMKFVHHLQERGVPVVLGAIAKQPTSFDNMTDAFQQSLEHEQYITSRIHTLVTLAQQTKDYAFGNFLQWFVDEQVEEEAQVQEVLDMIRHSGGEKNILIIDRYLASRE